jgi:hypothetical protein
LVLGYVYFLLNKQVIVDSVVKGNIDPKITRETIESGITTLLWTLVIGAVVFAVLFALFAYKAREGTRSARSILAVLFVLALLFQFLLQLLAPIPLFGLILALFALALMFWPTETVRGYFPKVGRKLS